MTTTWILTANANRAYLYSATRARLLNGDSDLKLVGEFSHPESRKKSGELVASKSGKFHHRKCGYGTFVESSEAKKVEMIDFAKEIADKLEKACDEHRLEDLILVAPPAFHGLLNKYMKKAANSVSIDIEKDYTSFNSRELVARLQAHL